jgi:hypothetical protein
MSVAYLIAVPAIMLGSILFVGGLIGLITGREHGAPADKAPRKKSRPYVMPGFRRPWR